MKKLYDRKLKSRVAMEALRGDQTIAEIAGGSSFSKLNLYVEHTLRLETLPERDTPAYAMGETVTFVSHPCADGQSADTGTIELKVTMDSGRTLAETKGSPAGGNAVSAAAALDVPGFLRCDAIWEIDGKPVATAVAATGIEPDGIQPAIGEPADFSSFWKNGLRELARIPEDARIVASPDLSNEVAEVYRVSFANVHDKRIYGILSVPRADGTYPVIINIPGAGPAEAQAPGLRFPDAITLFMNVHSYEPEAADSATLDVDYQAVHYQGQYYPHIGRTAPETYFFRYAYLGIYRAIDYVRRHPKYDGDSIGIIGSSQGGGSALILSGLNPDFKFTVANVPALCDHGGYRLGRRSGWPQVVESADVAERDTVLRAVSYYDAVNFARRIHNRVIVIVGWVDPTCPPSSVYAAYNVIPAPDKQLIPEYTMAHEIRDSYNTAMQTLREALRENHRKLAK